MSLSMSLSLSMSMSLSRMGNVLLAELMISQFCPVPREWYCYSVSLLLALIFNFVDMKWNTLDER